MSEPTKQRSQGALERVARLAVAVARGKDAGKLVTLEVGASASVGTAPDNALVLQDPTVSRYHLELRPSAEGIVVLDLGSTNGTISSGVRIREGAVPRGAQIRIGDTLLVVDAADGDGELAARDEGEGDLPGMVIVSASMREISRRVRALAGVMTTVLVHGETGTGKELVTRALHDLGPRANGPFVVVDCASLPPSLLEAELFGHERGAFTGADRARAGAFERGNGGTIFLDEIGELPLPAQASLLGVLERRRFRRVGGDREISVDVRIVSATNRDLRAEVNRGTYRADLYYRLATARVALPKLSERPEDIPPLIAHFALELTGDATAVPADIVEVLAAQPWPGNVRELRGAIERLVALGPAELAQALDVEEGRTASASTAPPTAERSVWSDNEPYRDAKARATTTFERAFVTMLMETCKGNVSEAARRARMDRPYLLVLLKRYGLR